MNLVEVPSQRKAIVHIYRSGLKYLILRLVLLLRVDPIVLKTVHKPHLVRFECKNTLEFEAETRDMVKNLGVRTVARRLKLFWE